MKRLYKVFLEKYDNQLSKQSILKIKNILIAEGYRYSGQWVKILFIRMSIIEKIRLVLNSNSFLYRLKNIFLRFFG